jgi:hypothetical protein
MWEGDGVEGEEEEGFREWGVCCFGFGWGVVEEAWGAQVYPVPLEGVDTFVIGKSPLTNGRRGHG